jgi:hypothetical protein
VKTSTVGNVKPDQTNCNVYNPVLLPNIIYFTVVDQLFMSVKQPSFRPSDGNKRQFVLTQIVTSLGKIDN